VNRMSPLLLVIGLIAIAPYCGAQVVTPVCPLGEMDVHVRQQMLQYGPQSVKHEFFGFIYLSNGVIGSAITRGSECRSADHCPTSTGPAAGLIPKGAKVLGEWHTHPREGSSMLSMDDVRGAHANVRIRCYVAYYAKPDGEIFAWDPAETSVPTAMASRVPIGNYVTQAAEPRKGQPGYDTLVASRRAGASPEG
jgi:hypothetical protein